MTLVIVVLRPSSDRLHQPRDYISLGLLFIESKFLENLENPLHTSPRFDLGYFVVLMRRNFFVFYATNPSVVSEPYLCVDGFARVEHMWMWALMIMLLLPCFVIFILGGIVG